MKNSMALFFVCLLFAGCKTWDISKMNVKNEPLSPRLLTLEKKIEDIQNVAFVANEDRMRIFTKEVEENLTDPFGEKYGYLIMKQNIIKLSRGPFWTCPNAWTVCIAMLFGCPIAHYKHVIDVEFRIMDSKNRLVGKYSAIGRGSGIAAMYYGYTVGKAMRKSYIDALNNAFDQMRPQIQKDASAINEKLNLSGKL